MKRVSFETFGCRLNRAEALQMEADYIAAGWQVTDSHKDADLIIVRCCSVTRRAEADSQKLIDHLHAKYPRTRVLAVGCIKEKVGRAPTRPVASSGTVSTRTARAYLKVQDGCNGACTFCIVPTFRGKSVSTPFQDVLATAQKFIAAGYHELVVTGCNLSHYLSDGKRIPEVLAALADLSPDCRIRLGSLEPSPVAATAVDVITEKANICNFLHVPIQSGSDRILSAMRRPYLHREVDALLKKATTQMPGLGLGCDIIVGFPDEKDIDYFATQSLLSRHPFTKAHIFPYSERPGTQAIQLTGALPREVRHARARELARQMDEVRTRYVRRFLGHVVEVVVEAEDPCVGWTAEYVWCQFKGFAKRKELVRVLITDLQGHILLGKRV